MRALLRRQRDVRSTGLPRSSSNLITRLACPPYASLTCAVLAPESFAMRTLRRRSEQRHGAAVVETAVVLPVYILLVFGIIEFGHAHLVVNLLQSGCRNGARMGSTAGPTTAEVIARVRQTLGAAVDATKVDVFVQDASELDDGGTWPTTDEQVEALPAIELSTAADRTLFVVRASVAYNDISLLPMPFLAGMRLQAQCFMRHE